MGSSPAREDDTCVVLHRHPVPDFPLSAEKSKILRMFAELSLALTSGGLRELGLSRNTVSNIWSRAGAAALSSAGAARGEVRAHPRRLLSFEFLDPLFDRFLIEAPVRAHLKGWNSTIF